MNTGILEYCKRVEEDAKEIDTQNTLHELNGTNQEKWGDYETYEEYLQVEEKKQNDLIGLPKDDPILVASFYIIVFGMGTSIGLLGYEMINTVLKGRLDMTWLWLKVKVNVNVIPIGQYLWLWFKGSGLKFLDKYKITKQRLRLLIHKAWLLIIDYWLTDGLQFQSFEFK